MKISDRIKQAISGDKKELCDLMRIEYPIEVKKLEYALGPLNETNFWEFICSIETFYKTVIKRVGKIRKNSYKFLVKSEYDHLGDIKLYKDKPHPRRNVFRYFMRYIDLDQLVQNLFTKNAISADDVAISIKSSKRYINLYIHPESFKETCFWKCLVDFCKSIKLSRGVLYQRRGFDRACEFRLPIDYFLKFFNSMNFRIIKNPTATQKIAAIAVDVSSDVLQKRKERKELYDSGMTKIMTRIAIEILKAMDSQKKTKEDIANSTGLSVEIIDMIIRGKHKDITFYEVKKIFNYLNINITFNINE